MTKFHMNNHKSKIDRYYKLHSKIYDLTRWSILFGRKRLLESLAVRDSGNFRILEAGVGTGTNLSFLRRLYPNIRLVGLDISDYMLDVARNKFSGDKFTKFISAPFSESIFKKEEKFDIIIFSYCLSMFHDHWHKAILDSKKLLREGGQIGVVDFHNARNSIIKTIWEKVHVKMGGFLQSTLVDNFDTTLIEIEKAYGGLWEYFSFIGISNNPETEFQAD